MFLVVLMHTNASPHVLLALLKTLLSNRPLADDRGEGGSKDWSYERRGRERDIGVWGDCEFLRGHNVFFS